MRRKEGCTLEKYCLIMDDCPEYAKKLELYLNSHTDFGYHAVFLSAPEMAQEYVQSGAVAAILASETLEKEVLLLAGKLDVPVFWLCEEKKKLRENAIFRYQPARFIMEQLGKREEKRDSLPVFAVFSPSGGVWQEELFCRVAMGFSEHHRVLCFSLLPFASESRSEENGMSELLFYVKQGREAFLNFLRRQEAYGRNPAMFGPLRWSTDLQNISPSDVEEMIRGGVAAGGYDLILFAVSYYDMAGRSILAASDAIFVPVVPSKAGKDLQEEFIRQLRESGENRILTRMVELSAERFDDGIGILTASYDAVRKGEEIVAGHTGNA